MYKFIVLLLVQEEGMPYSQADKLELVSSTGMSEQPTTSKLISIHDEMTKLFPRMFPFLDRCPQSCQSIFE